MTIEQLRAARDGNPFIPFVIHMADGRAHRIPHRDYLSMSPGGRIVMIYREDAFSMIGLLLVTELEMEAIPQMDRAATG